VTVFKASLSLRAAAVRVLSKLSGSSREPPGIPQSSVVGAADAHLLARAMVSLVHQLELVPVRIQLLALMSAASRCKYMTEACPLCTSMRPTGVAPIL
jgi:hypothetical protein